MELTPLCDFLKLLYLYLLQLLLLSLYTILAFQVFDQVFILTGGGPSHSTTVVVLELYQQAFLKYRFGYAAAMAMVLFICILGITVIQYFISEKKEIVY